MPLVRSRDDLSVELCALYNQTGSPNKALRILETRKSQPWEGGEGLALRQHVRAHLALGRLALRQHMVGEAIRQFNAARNPAENLGEANHLLANQGDIHYWLGCALDQAGDNPGARASWEKAAQYRGDFQAMRVRAFSEMTYYSAMSLRNLGRKAEANRLLRELLGYSRRLASTPAKIDYFATSLPTMLLFEDDPGERQRTNATFLAAQAHIGFGRKATGRRLLRDVLRHDPSHPFAADQPA